MNVGLSNSTSLSSGSNVGDYTVNNNSAGKSNDLLWVLGGFLVLVGLVVVLVIFKRK